MSAGERNQLQAPVAPNSEESIIFFLSSANEKLAPFTQFKQFILYHNADDTYERFSTVYPLS